MDNDFETLACKAVGGPLVCVEVETVQVNVGFLCNQACAHCHLEAGPRRTEQMSAETVDQVLAALEALGRPTLDVTGGAPELNPEFRRLVAGGREGGSRVMVRTNLTALIDPEQDGLPQFLAEHGAVIVASMPCYLEENVDRQRGKGAYAESVRALQRLNELGYGKNSRELNLVYNPVGAFLPGPQDGLEQDYREHLRENFGIEFNSLFVITNMPIGRFGKELERNGDAAQYHALLRDSFNPATVEGLMCRRQINVGPDGTLYDCDFNLALGLPAEARGCAHVRDATSGSLADRPIVTGAHCFACTAGSGSSCTGALAGA